MACHNDQAGPSQALWSCALEPGLPLRRQCLRVGGWNMWQRTQPRPTIRQTAPTVALPELASTAVLPFPPSMDLPQSS